MILAGPRPRLQSIQPPSVALCPGASDGLWIMRELVSYASLAGSILLGIAGQITLKTAANESATVAAQFQNPITLLGLAIYLFAALCYIVALKQIPVSVAFPSVSTGYVIVALIAHFLWGEPFGWPQIGGLVLIASGVLLIHQH